MAPFTKLNSDAVAFETVRKWTSKFDIFQKKYIIVEVKRQVSLCGPIEFLTVLQEREHPLVYLIKTFVASVRNTALREGPSQKYFV